MKTAAELRASNFRRSQDGRIKPISPRHYAEWQDKQAAEDADINATLPKRVYRRYTPSPERIASALNQMDEFYANRNNGHAPTNHEPACDTG